MRVLVIAPAARRLHYYIRYAWGIRGEFRTCLVQVQFSTMPDYIRATDRYWDFMRDAPHCMSVRGSAQGCS